MKTHDEQIIKQIRFKASLAEGFSTLTKYLAGAAIVATILVIGFNGFHAAGLCIAIGCAYAFINAYDVWNNWA